MSAFKELIRRVKSEIREVSAEEARDAAAAGAVLVDVREADEWAQGHAPGAVFIPRGFLELRVEEKVPDKDAGRWSSTARAARAARSPRARSRTWATRNVSSLAGGFARWKEAGFPVVGAATPDGRAEGALQPPPARARGGRGRAGAAPRRRRCCWWAPGGLGSPAGLYLAAAGVGTLGIVDSDVVDLSNLQRQVLHTTASRGPAQDRVRRGHDPRPEPRREGRPPRPAPGREQRTWT